MRFFPLISVLIFFLLSCQTGNLEVIADITIELKEVSAVEQIRGSELYWVIEDAGNNNRLYGLDSTGVIQKSLRIDNSENIDWEDLTADNEGSIYIGDFGNNNRNRKTFSIYKISSVATSKESASAEIINFELPKESRSLDFESFFIWKNSFYIFSKENGKFEIFKVENRSGNQTAWLMDEYNFKGKGNEITSADISEDGKTVLLLNHTKLWIMTDFAKERFFSGKIKSVPFNHSSQKEGVCFGNRNEIIITDENSGVGSNIYKLKSGPK